MFQAQKLVPQASKVAIAVAMLAAASLSHAATGGLYNSGVDGSGNVLADGAADSHYTVTLLDTINNPALPTFAVSSTQTYGAAWNVLDAGSKWITPLLGTGNTAGDVTGHDYLFTTSFNLNGYDFSTASISGKLMTDNGLAKILVNGVDSGQTFGGTDQSQTFRDWYSFSALSGFHNGVNTISFEVLNASGPTGLRTELTSNFAVAAVPEPESYAMLLAGLGLMGAIARRRNKRKA